VVEQSFRPRQGTAGGVSSSVFWVLDRPTDRAFGRRFLSDPRLSSSRQILRSVKIITLRATTAMDNTLDSMSQHELLAELDIVERAIGRTAAFDLRTDEVGQTRVSVSRELLALAEREYLIVAELRHRQMQLAA
jgi:transcription termination factor NusB